MLHEFDYYFALAQEVAEGTLVEKRDFVQECYCLAELVPITKVWRGYYNVQSATELETIRNEVVIAMAELDSSSLNYDFGVKTPVTHMKEQLKELYDKIVSNLRDCDLQHRIDVAKTK